MHRRLHNARTGLIACGLAGLALATLARPLPAAADLATPVLAADGPVTADADHARRPLRRGGQSSVAMPFYSFARRG